MNKIIDGETHNIFIGNVISIIDDPKVEESLIYGKQKYAKYTNFDNNEIGLNKLNVRNIMIYQQSESLIQPNYITVFLISNNIK